jgi:hypothetical protein
MKILLVHGVGHSETNPQYYEPWKQEITAGLTAAGFQGVPDYTGLLYDDIFEKHYAGPGTYVTALTELAATAVEHEIIDPIADFIHGLLHPSRDLVYGGDTVRWSAGMVAQFAIEDGLRRDLRDRFAAALATVYAKALADGQPLLLAAHSLGSLLTYDFLHNDKRAAQYPGLTYLTFGSQINNTFVRDRLWPEKPAMPSVHVWFHLYNKFDPVFTADIAIPTATNFQSVPTPSHAGHSPIKTADGPGYLDHPNTQQSVWPAIWSDVWPVSAPVAAARNLIRTFAAVRSTAPRATRTAKLPKPRRRALLIGLNDYPDPQNCLEGCVNDTFLVSAMLQERGFKAEDIRVVLNKRATAAAIRERLVWLLEDVADGMERVLFYSGHGAQLPGYNAAEKIDHVDECLVPYDFAWTKETAITDDDFYRLYSDLPFTARFFTIFDCCHAGGMTRDGSHKVRGITPPDDIRHRLLEWNQKEQMWKDRKFAEPINKNYGGTAEERRQMMGKNGVTYRLGRGMKLRRHLSKAGAQQLVKDKQGLYLPVLLEACGEGQLSYEYRFGTVSYGAFTYSLVKNLRNAPASSFTQLMTQTTETLTTLGYAQAPQLVGPTKVLDSPVPGGRPSSR